MNHDHATGPGTVGRRIRQAREEAGLTQEELAQASGVSVRTISNLERGRAKRPYPSTLRALARALDLPDVQFLLSAQRKSRSLGLPRTAVLSPEAVPPRQLPASPAVFVGRRAQLAALDGMLDDQDTMMIAAITGTGGIGKTWLALHWAHKHLDRFPDGQVFVDLRGFSPSGEPLTPQSALGYILDALGVRPGSIPKNLDAQAGLYRSLVADRRILIVLDNARSTEQVSKLLPGAATCAVLVTSRDKLSGLVTAHSARSVAVDVFDAQEACRLLTRRLGGRRLDAETDTDTVAQMADACAGLPLALSVLAGRAELHPRLPLADLVTELRDAANLLTSLTDGDPAANLRTVFSCSCAALPPGHADVFGLLALAPGPDISTAAAASLVGLPTGQAAAILGALERASLLEQHASGRYRMHDLIRLYGAEQALATIAEEERECALSRLVDFYLHTAYAGDRLVHPHRSLHRALIKLASPAPSSDPVEHADASEALAWFDAEHPCLLAIHRFVISRGRHEEVLQIAWALDTFHLRRGRLHDNLVTWRHGLAAALQLDSPAAQTLAYRLLGVACTWLDFHDEAVDAFQRALELAGETGDPPTQAHTHIALARVRSRQADNQSALNHATEAMRLYQTIGNLTWQASALNSMGWYAALLGRFTQAHAHCQDALKLHRQDGYRQGEASVLDSLGYICHQSGDLHLALDYFTQALILFRALGNQYDEADTLSRVGQTYVALNRFGEARTAWQQALGIYRGQRRDAEVGHVERQLAKLEC